MTKKIYFSKSNKADPDETRELRKALEFFDVEIIEFKGGTYSAAPILGVDLMLVQPPADFYGVIGRGQYEQIDTAMNHGIPCFLYRCCWHDEPRIDVNEIYHVEKINFSSPDWNAYAEIEHGEDRYDLRHFEVRDRKRNNEVFPRPMIKSQPVYKNLIHYFKRLNKF